LWDLIRTAIYDCYDKRRKREGISSTHVVMILLFTLFLPRWVWTLRLEQNQKLHKKNKGSLFVSGFPISPFFYLATDFDLPPSPSLRPICGVLRLWLRSSDSVG
jgi:hypothetical protein